MDQVILNVIRSKQEMLKALFESKITRTIIGINSKALGPGTYMTTVTELIIGDNDETKVVLKGYDMTGYFFDKSILTLDEIDGVIPFTSLFENPFLRDLRRDVHHDASTRLRAS